LVLPGDESCTHAGQPDTHAKAGNACRRLIARIRMVVGVLSFLGGLGQAYLTEDMSSAESVLNVGAHAFITYVTSSALYLYLKR
jgi:hypothetical protein